VLGGSNARRALELALAGRMRPVSSTHLMSELEDVLVRRFGYSPAAARETRLEMELVAVLVEPARVPGVCRDPDDDHVLAAAAGGRAGWIVTGDKDLLELRSCCGVEILTVAHFLELAQGW